jgi:hypothetical protein
MPLAQRAASNLQSVPADSARAHNGTPDVPGRSFMHAATPAEAVTRLDEDCARHDLDGAVD